MGYPMGYPTSPNVLYSLVFPWDIVGPRGISHEPACPTILGFPMGRPIEHYMKSRGIL